MSPSWRAVFCQLGLLVSFTRSVSSNQEVSHPGKRITLFLQTPSRGGSRCCGFSCEAAGNAASIPHHCSMNSPALFLLLMAIFWSWKASYSFYLYACVQCCEMLRGMGNIGRLNRGPESPENGITLITNGHDVNMYANVSFPFGSMDLITKCTTWEADEMHQPAVSPSRLPSRAKFDPLSLKEQRTSFLPPRYSGFLQNLMLKLIHEAKVQSLY